MPLPTIATHHLGDGLRQDFCVQPQRPVIDILAVQLHDLLEVLDGSVALKLPQPRQSGFDTETAPMMIQVYGDLIVSWRARADQAHLALEHVPELGQFVEMTAAELASGRRHARVALE